MGWVEIGELLRRFSCVVVLAFTFGGLPYDGWVFPLQSQEKAAKPQAMAIDINKATVNDLQRLPGIGPSLAKQIVAYRDKNGPFRRVEDLMVIKGIGFKKWKKIRPLVRVGDLK
jgi:comEA protein